MIFNNLIFKVLKALFLLRIQSSQMFRTVLVVFLIILVAYTFIVGLEHGWNIIGEFFSQIKQMKWAGQFNMDFLMFLILSGIWVSWRTKFSLQGILLGFVAVFGGMLFLTIYLLILHKHHNGDHMKVLLGAQNDR